MKAYRKITEYLVLVAAISLLLSGTAAAGWWNKGKRCDDVYHRGHLNVLSFNLLFFAEEASVEDRLQPLVAFLREHEVDVIFLQEVVGGALALSEFTNSAKILQETLSSEGLEYNLRTAFEIGVPGLFYTGNATLSRCEIRFSLVNRLPRQSEIEIFGRPIKLPRNVQMTRIKIPGFGQFSAYNTHLCAGCTTNERNQQLSKLFSFMNRVEHIIPGDNPVLLAGDFNIDRFRSDEESEAYDAIANRGYADAYAEAKLAAAPGTLDVKLCAPENDPDEHCTVNVTAFDLPEGHNARRIDYIFRKGFSEAVYSEVIFNPVVDESEPSDLTSDHAAVYAEIPLSSISQ